MDLTSYFTTGLGTIAESAYLAYHDHRPIRQWKDLEWGERRRWEEVVRAAVSEAMVLHKNATRYGSSTPIEGSRKKGNAEITGRDSRGLPSPERESEEGGWKSQ